MLPLCFALPPRQWQLLARLGAASLPPGDYTGSWLPASPFQHLSSNCRDNCHKSNCSCWITSILHHHPQLPRASTKLLFQGRKAAPLDRERLNQAGSGHLKQSPRTEPPPDSSAGFASMFWDKARARDYSQEAART